MHWNFQRIFETIWFWSDFTYVVQVWPHYYNWYCASQMCFMITAVNHNLSLITLLLTGPAHGPQRGRHKQVGLKISLSLKNNFTSQNQEAYLYQSPRSLSEVVQELTKNGIDHLLPTKYGIHYGLSFPYFSLYSYLLYFCWLSNCHALLSVWPIYLCIWLRPKG